VTGYLKDEVAGLIGSCLHLDHIPQTTAQEFVEFQKQDPSRVAVLDVREAGEVSGGVIEHSAHIPLGETQVTNK
jgi:uncharacterized protein YcsI (UPF0317 family)